jgi:hypothetical protein
MRSALGDLRAVLASFLVFTQGRAALLNNSKAAFEASSFSFSLLRVHIVCN